MITTDQELAVAQQGIENLQRILVEARKVHQEGEYRAMSAPILLELQRREHEVLEYLSHASAELMRRQSSTRAPL